MSVWSGVRRTSSGLFAWVRAAWTKSVRLAGLPGMGWLIGGFLAANAVAMGVITHNRHGESLVGIVLSEPWQRSGEKGCWFPSDRDIAVVLREQGGGRCVQPLSATPQATLWLESTAQLHLHCPAKQSEGIWSPWLETEHARSVTLMVSGTFGEWEEPQVRQALIDAWPSLAAIPSVTFAQRPLEPFEVEAIKSGTSPARRSINWSWLANDLLVLAAGFLLCASHPARLARWRAARSRREIVNCPSCRYVLAGLPSNVVGERTCPECGSRCAAFS